MKTLTSACLSAAGIAKVIWIDDKFASPSRDESAQIIRECVLQLKEQGQRNIDWFMFADVDLTQPRGEVENVCENIMEEKSDTELAQAAARLSVLSGIPAAKAESEPDFSDEEFEALQKAFGPGLRTFSLKTWTSEGVSELSTLSDDTLIIIDKEFKREPGGIDGTQLLGDIVLQKKTEIPFCILLTHRCSESEQEQSRIDIATTGNFPAYRFCVLSKKQSIELTVDARFAHAIRAVMTHKFNGEIAHAICSTIKISADTTATALTRQSVTELEQALFENSIQEGVIEYDVVLRVFEIEQRSALNNALQDAAIQKQLRTARKFRTSTACLGRRTGQADMSFFRDLRQREVFLEGTGLNKLHAPLSCGDVFETQFEKGKKYLFLAQPCDLMVRKNGERRAEVGLLTLVNEDSEKQEHPGVHGHRFFEIKGVFGNDRNWRIDFQNVIVVDLDVIEFAAFNTDGQVLLHRDHEEPSIMLTRGWSKRLNRAKSRIFPKDKKPVVPMICLGQHSAELEGSVIDDSLSYPLRRIGRFEPNTATAILAAWATFQTRAALEYDFAASKPVVAKSVKPEKIPGESNVDASPSD